MSQKSLNFNVPIVGFDGKDSGEGTLGQLLMRILASEQSDDKLEFIKLSGWVKVLYDKKPLELDKSDLEKLKGLVEKTKGLVVWHKALLFEILEAEDKEVTNKKSK